MSITDPTKCVYCDNLIAGSATVASVAALALVALLAFICFVVRKPAALKRWVSTIVIVINHTQTISVISSLQLD